MGREERGGVGIGVMRQDRLRRDLGGYGKGRGGAGREGKDEEGVRGDEKVSGRNTEGT